jgi:N-terminal domain of reverse transcriptase
MSTAATPMDEWNALPWKRSERQVFKLQQRIYRAARRGDTQAVHKLQRLLLTSRAARTLAVRNVTQDNRGKWTAGEDGVRALPPPTAARPRPFPAALHHGAADASGLDPQAGRDGAAAPGHPDPG